MKKNACFSYLYLSFLGLLSISFSQCGQKQIPPGADTMQQETTILRTQTGETFTLLLEGRMGTGFRWALEGDLPAGLVQVKEDVFNPEDKDDVQRFQYLAEKKGTYDLLFAYRRSWEEKPLSEVKQKAFQIIVK